MVPTCITSVCDQLVTLFGFLTAHGSALILPVSLILFKAYAEQPDDDITLDYVCEKLTFGAPG
jgi:hypothetical protein